MSAPAPSMEDFVRLVTRVGHLEERVDQVAEQMSGIRTLVRAVSNDLGRLTEALTIRAISVDRLERRLNEMQEAQAVRDTSIQRKLSELDVAIQRKLGDLVDLLQPRVTLP